MAQKTKKNPATDKDLERALEIASIVAETRPDNMGGGYWMRWSDLAAQANSPWHYYKMCKHLKRAGWTSQKRTFHIIAPPTWKPE